MNDYSATDQVLDQGWQAQMHTGPEIKKELQVEGRTGPMFIANFISIYLLHHMTNWVINFLLLNLHFSRVISHETGHQQPKTFTSKEKMRIPCGLNSKYPLKFVPWRWTILNLTSPQN